MNVTTVTVEVRIPGGRAWMGRGRNLTEALSVVDSLLVDSSPEERRAAALALQGPPVVADITSDGRWWNPFTWGDITVRWTVARGP